MTLKGKKIGYIFTGSFCTFQKSIVELKKIVGLGNNVLPIMSYNSYNLDTKFGMSKDIIKEIEQITNNKIIHTIPDAEPIGPKHLTDIMLIAPASGNTMAKLANDIIDTPAVMAAKSHLRNENPLVIAPSTNNGLAGNAINIGKLLNTRNIYFVPFKQDNPISKPRSIVFESSYIIPTLEMALDGKQIQPILQQL